MFKRKKQEGLMKNNKKKSFLDEQIRDLSDDLNDLRNVRLSFIIFCALAILFLFYLIIDYLYTFKKFSGAGFWISVISFPLYIIMGTISLKSINKFIRKTKNKYDIAVKERQAEKEVQGFLRKNLTEEYHIFENVYTGFGDIDAIVVGSAGVYMIEVKSNSGVVTTNEKGYLSIIDGDTPNKNYREQVIKELSQVKKYIDNNTGLKSWVNPVLVFPFGSVWKDLFLDSEYDNYKIPVLNEKDLMKYIYSNNQTPLTPEQVKKISQVLEEWQKD
jgi:hypothetical protein